MEPYKAIVSKQIPRRLQTKEFNVLLNTIKKRNIKDREDLAGYLKNKEMELREWLETHKQGVVGASRKQKTSELKFLSFVKTRFMQYLKQVS